MTVERAHRRRSHIGFLRTMGAHRRSGATDLILATALAFVAGAINAGGFVAIGQYTSHMTGVVSAITDNIALGTLWVVAGGLGALTAFTAGSATSAILINWGRRHIRSRQYAYPIALEGLLLLGFGGLGGAGHQAQLFVAFAVPLLCFIMGLQNATITKISGARMRTTHVTGMVTDIGIELGKVLYRNQDRTLPENLRVRPDRMKLSILLRVLGMFFVGGVVGAFGFGYFGYVFTVPLAAILFALSIPQLTRSRHAKGLVLDNHVDV